MLVYVCLYVKYNDNCSSVSKFNVSKTDSRFELVRKQKQNVATRKFFLPSLTYI